MEYRIHPKTGDKIGVIGIGTGPIFDTMEREAAAALNYAYEHGVNYLDFATAGAKTFPYVGAALGSVRRELFYQIHFGANYESGEYGWTTNLDTIKRQVDWQKILDTGLVEQLMFSINPAYDYQHGEFAIGSASERMKLYQRCEAEGIGISVMKPYSAGQLLNDKTSPFGRALTKVQCLQYALDKPGVLTVLPGIRNLEDMKEALSWLDASPEERDYSVLGTFTPKDVTGTCVYCNHCAPCPAGLNIGLINKYYDLAKIGDAMAADHYAKLEKHASDCVSCGHCDRRCPFHVAQPNRMKTIAEYFGR